MKQRAATETIALLSSTNLRVMNKRDTRNIYEGVFVLKKEKISSFIFYFFFFVFLFSPLHIKQKPESTMNKYLHEKWRQNKGEKYQKHTGVNGI